ncbi:MAG: type I-E CRISPR-associated protein Cse2/CasB [Candidatus Methanomethylophilus sp.]|nr:type I-E CRISPR-associated protein Cse2/CasB [Methanomethylophilus sp.]MDD4668818.1 type I-E CRISPR-associated protein Cse2/CasB [Methanomethylophilus sp.]
MSKSDTIYGFVSGKVQALQGESPWTKAMLARLRHGLGKDLTEATGSWEVVLAGIPDELVCGRAEGCETTPAERAVFTALTLFALHRQGNSAPVEVQGVSFATAVRRLVGKGNEEAVKRRFDTVMTSTDLQELSNHARGLVQLMKAADRPVGFDYPRFAKDLYAFQFPEGRQDVILRWGQDFYKLIEKNDEKSKDGE